MSTALEKYGQQKENDNLTIRAIMKTVISLALFAWAAFAALVLAAQPVPNDQQIMIIIVIGNGQNGGRGVS